jgi:hypothetical protein
MGEQFYGESFDAAVDTLGAGGGLRRTELPNVQ